MSLLLVSAALSLGLSTPPEEEVHRTDFYTVHSHGAAEPDIAQVVRLLDSGVGQLRAAFLAHDVDDFLKDADVQVVVYGAPTERAGVNRTTIQSGTRDGTPATYFATIHILGLSVYPAGAQTSSGEPKDEHYLARVLTHEYSTVILDGLTRRKPTGWGFHSAPDWFVQGYQEYLGLTCSSEAARTRSLERYTRIVREDPERVSAAFGVEVQDPYISGAVLLRFMHEKYGQQPVQALLISEERTFGRAVRAVLKVTVEDFDRDWQAWLTTQRP